jgi:ATPase subunit of ABC transporter with duplicated ATPase domains
MPPILNAQSVTKQFGAKPLFKGISLTVEDSDRIGLIGPNGAGKSTLLALLAGQVEPDSGELAVRKRARAAYVPQDSRFAPNLTVRQVLEQALASTHVNESEREGRIRELAGRAGFADLDAEAASLSGGWRKRLAIVEAMVIEPDVMLLDEPTNHLDLAGIEWLEELLASASFAAVTVSHDRYFLESTSSQIVELNRIFADGLFRVKGTFSRFLEEKQAYLESQSRQQESLRNRVRTEIEWLRRGPKARTTKSKARIDTAHAMIGQLASMDSRTTVNSAGIDFEASMRKTKRLVTFEAVSCAIPGGAVGPGFSPDISTTKNARALAPEFDENPDRESLVLGHDFSRAEKANKYDGALAPANASALRSPDHVQNEPRRNHESGLDFSRADRSPKNAGALAPAESPAPRTLFSNLNFALTAGMKVGLVGPNGSGKTTLLRLLLGEIEPAAGTIKRAEALRMVYFSQMRELDESLTLRRALAPEGDGIIHQGRTIHVASWAARFLFTGEQLNQPVRNLSGGERARVLIAKLMLEPADVLLLDEPTNDLDIPTLEILEDNLLEFPGALVLVTHDRYLLNRVSSVVLGLDGRSHIAQFADFAQWEDWLIEQDSAQSSTATSSQKPTQSGKSARRADGSLSAKQSQAISVSTPSPANSARKKLSYLEAREFAIIEQKVEASDARLHAARDRVDQPEIASNAAALQQALVELDAAQHESDALYARWAELTEKAG